MKLNKIKNKRAVYLPLFLSLIGYCLLYVSAEKERDKIANIKANGIETIGTIIDKHSSHRRSAIDYSIHFDFECGGQRIVKYQTLYDDSQLYNEAIIGMKYKVKYLPDSPNENSVIYIKEPIYEEYININKERGRIFNKNKKAQKKARAIEEILYLIPYEFWAYLMSK